MSDLWAALAARRREISHIFRSTTCYLKPPGPAAVGKHVRCFRLFSGPRGRGGAEGAPASVRANEAETANRRTRLSPAREGSRLRAQHSSPRGFQGRQASAEPDRPRTPRVSAPLKHQARQLIKCVGDFRAHDDERSDHQIEAKPHQTLKPKTLLRLSHVREWPGTELNTHW